MGFSMVNVSVAALACLVELFNFVVWVKNAVSTQLSLFDRIMSPYLKKKVSFTILQNVFRV